VLSKIDKEILSYCLDKYPEEACGILLNKKGHLVWVPCDNVAEDKESNFVLDSTQYLQAHFQGDIHSIVHSHTNSSSKLSEADKKASDFLKIPYTVYSVPDGEKTTYHPPDSNNLLGRTYEFGVQDCWILVRDYYKQEYNITLPLLDFEDDWWMKGLNYFDDYFTDFGFVEAESPEKGDVILFSVRSTVPNHCGVYLGEGLFMHHAENRLSCRESLYPFWVKQITRYSRYAKS